MSTRRILLTGASGFVGSAVLKQLLEEGNEVVAISGSRAPDFRHDRLEWQRLDLLRTSGEQMAGLIRAAQVSHCLHAAWYTNHADYLTADVNRDWLSASLRLVDTFYAAGGSRFVGLGTCVEYGDPGPGRPCIEEVTPIEPRTLYAACKVELFQALRERAEETGIDHAWSRLFFIYGPGDRANRLVPSIVEKLSRGERVAAKFGGLRRDFIHVADLAGQLSGILASNVQGAVNTGTGTAVSIADVFMLMGDLFGRPDLVVVNDAVSETESPLIAADLSRFRRGVGEPPTRDFRDGLAEVVAAAKAR